MKFRDFVGEPEIIKKKLKKMVDTPLGQTEEGFYNQVARRDEHRPITETSVGYGLSKLQLKRTFDYIKSWLIRYNIVFETINPYLTVTTVEGNYKKDRFIKALKKVKEDQVFFPDGIFLLREGETDFIIIEYKKNEDFIERLDECVSNFSLVKYQDVCYVKLFSIKAKSFDLELFDQMVYSQPDLPKAKPGSVGLLTRRKR
jgi:hypothetical protein